MRPRRTLTILAALALAAIAVWFFRPAPPRAPPDAAARALTNAAPLPTVPSTPRLAPTPTLGVPPGSLIIPPPPPPSAAAPVRPPTPSVRTELPRFGADHYQAGLRSIPLPHPTANLTDRRPNPGPRAQEEMEAINYGIDSLDEEVANCLSQWSQTIGLDAGQVLIGFNVDPTGLHGSWVQSDSEIPFGPRTCLSNAVYGIDWSHIVDEPGQVTHWYSLSLQDGG